MCVPAIGKLADQRHCRARIWWVGYFLHMVGLVAAGAAPNIELLIAARCITGLASACITPTGFALMVRGVAPARRGQIAAVQEAVMVISPSVGMVAGGWIADHIGWRLLMVAPVPGVIVTWLFSLFVIPFDSQQLADDLSSKAAERSKAAKEGGKRLEPEPEPDDQPFDFLGAAVFAVGMGLLLVAVTKGNDWGWTSDIVAGCGAGAAVSFLLLYHVERHWAKEAIFSRRLFADPVVGLAIFILMGCDTAYMGAFLVMPMFLTQAVGMTITDAAQILGCRPAMGSVISICLAKLMGEKKEGRCTVSNLNLTLTGCFITVMAYSFGRFVLVCKSSIHNSHHNLFFREISDKFLRLQTHRPVRLYGQA